MKRLFRKLHLWLSVPFGLIITLICFSGAMLVFEREIAQLCNPSLYYAQTVSGRVLPMDEIVARARIALPADVEVQGVTVYPDPERAYQLSLSKPRRASMFVDQYTGEVKGVYQRSTFFSTMFGLHRWLLGNRPDDGGIFWGKTIIGISTLLFIVVLVSGIIIWWPRSLKGLKNSLKIRFRRGWHLMWHGMHVAGGMYVLLLLLVMALTGLTWSFGWYRTAFYKTFGVEMVQKNGSHGNDSSRDRKGLQVESTKYMHWQKVYEELAESNPDNLGITISDGTASVANNHYGNTRGSDRYKFDSNTGKLIEATPYSEMPDSGKMRGWIYSVHVGTFGGMATRILWFVVSLFGATLPITGYYLWVKRLMLKKKNIR